MEGEQVQEAVRDEDEFFAVGEFFPQVLQDFIQMQDLSQGFEALGEVILPLGFVVAVVVEIGVCPVDEVVSKSS